MTKRCIGARKVLKVSPTSPVNFSRETPAYLQDGTEVASGVPRFEGIGKNILNVDKFVELAKSYDSLTSVVYVDGKKCLRFRSYILYNKSFLGVFVNPELGSYTLKFSAKNVSGSTLYFGLSTTDGTYTPGMIKGAPLNWETRTVTTPADKTILQLYFSYGVGGAWLLDLDSLQLEKGVTATSYEPYEKGIFVEEGTTNLIPGNRQKFVGWTVWDGSVVTLTQNQTIPEWNTTEATRIIATAGNATRRNKYLYSVGTGTSGQSYCGTMYVKNIGSKSFSVNSNQGGKSTTVAAGESAFIKFENIVSNGVVSIQYQFSAETAEDGFDVIVYRPKYEQKAYPTSWTPSTRNDEVLIVPSLSAKTISVDVGFVLGSNDYATRESKTILALGNYQIVTWESNGAVKLYDGTSYYNIITAIVKNSKVRIGLVEENGEIKVYWNGELKLTIEGTLPNSDIYLGTNTSGERHVNAYFGDLHLASKPLQVTSMSPLPIDQFTLYSALNQGNLEASQGYYENFWCLPVKYDGTTTIHIRKDDDDNV